MPAPRWRGIADDLRERIKCGEWTVGQQLPTHREFMAHYGVTSQATVARALAALTAEGVLMSDPAAPRRGMRVRSRHLFWRHLVGDLRMEHERAVTDYDGELGLFEANTGADPDDTNVDITYESVVADAAIAERLGLAEGAPLLQRTFRYVFKGTPHQLARSYLDADLADTAGLADALGERPGLGTVGQLRAADVHVDRVRIELESRIPTQTEVDELAVPAGVPVFVLQRVMYAAERPVETLTAVVPGDRVAYTLTVELATGVTE